LVLRILLQHIVLDIDHGGVVAVELDVDDRNGRTDEYLDVWRCILCMLGMRSNVYIRWRVQLIVGVVRRQGKGKGRTE
jgi:hypothetical protein